MPHLQAFKLLFRYTQGPEDRVDLAMIHVGANCLANGALRQEKGWRSSENSDVEEPRLTSVQYSSPSQDFAAPPSPVQGRLVETHTHTHTHARTQTQTAHATTPSGSYRRRVHLRCAARPPGPRPAQSVGNARAGSGARSGYGRRTLTGLAGTREAVAIPASTRCFDFQVWAVGRRS